MSTSSTSQTGWSWGVFKTNIRLITPIIGILFLYIFLHRDTSSANAVHGGGFSTLLIAFVVFLLAHKFSNKVLQWIGSVLIVIWAWPRFIPIIGEFGISPGIILAVTIFFGIWLWKKGAGIFWWKRIIFIILLMSMVGNQGVVIRKGWNDFKTSTGIHLPSITIPDSIEPLGNAISEYFGHRANTTIADTKVGYIKVGTAMYSKNGTAFSEETIELSAYENDNDNVKIFFTGKTTNTDNGIPMEEILIGNPVTGTSAWVMSGDILFSEPSAKDLAVEKAAKLKAAGWVTVLVSKPDSRGFSSTTIPKGVVGKKIVTFRSCLYTQTRANGVESKIWTPRKFMSFSAPIKEWFVDVKFEKVPTDGKCWAKFQ
jgi:hypothetical protein